MSQPTGPGSPEWARQLSSLRDAELTPRRAELRRLADAVRGVLHRLVQTSAPVPMIAEAADDLEDIVDRFRAHPNASIYEGFAEAANAGEPFAFFDHSPMLGHANPLAPPIEIWLGGRPDGRARRRSAPPTRVRPDACTAASWPRRSTRCSGSTQSLAGAPGMTARLVVELPVADAAAHRPALRGHARPRRRPQDLRVRASSSRATCCARRPRACSSRCDPSASRSSRPAASSSSSISSNAISGRPTRRPSGRGRPRPPPPRRGGGPGGRPRGSARPSRRRAARGP